MLIITPRDESSIVPRAVELNQLTHHRSFPPDNLTMPVFFGQPFPLVGTAPQPNSV